MAGKRMEIAEQPMKTTMIERTGALCSGLRIARSMITPSTKEKATATMKASQKLRPQLMSCQLM
jgi:hypothetical protein